MPVSASLWAASSALRIASLDLCADEYLLMFAKREQIASVSRLASDRADSPLWRVARGLPTNRGQIEELVGLGPNVLLRTRSGGRSTTDIAGKLGMITVTLPYPATLDDVAHNVAKVTALTGQEDAGMRWNKRLSTLKKTAPHQVDAVFLGQGGLTVSPTSLSARWMRLAGYRQLPVPGGRLTLESLLLRSPPVLLRSNYRRAEISRGQQWLDHPLAARARSKMVVTDGRPWTCAGPLMIQEIERLRRVG